VCIPVYTPLVISILHVGHSSIITVLISLFNLWVHPWITYNFMNSVAIQDNCLGTDDQLYSDCSQFHISHSKTQYQILWKLCNPLIDDTMNCVFVFSMHSKKIYIKTDFLKLCHTMYVILLHLCIVSDTNKLTNDSIHLC